MENILKVKNLLPYLGTACICTINSDKTEVELTIDLIKRSIDENFVIKPFLIPINSIDDKTEIYKDLKHRLTRKEFNHFLRFIKLNIDQRLEYKFELSYNIINTLCIHHVDVFDMNMLNDINDKADCEFYKV